MVQYDLDPNRIGQTNKLESSRLDTSRLQAQLFQIEEISRSQSRQKLTMAGAANDLATALETALTQVEAQAERHNELLRVHQTFLGNIKGRSQCFNDSQKALEMAEEAPTAKRERDTGPYTQGMQTLYRRTTDRDQMLRDRRIYGANAMRDEHPATQTPSMNPTQ